MAQHDQDSAEQREATLLIETDLTADPGNHDKIHLEIQAVSVDGVRLDRVDVVSIPWDVWEILKHANDNGGTGFLEDLAEATYEQVRLNLYALDLDAGRIHPDVPLEGIEAMEDDDNGDTREASMGRHPTSEWSLKPGDQVTVEELQAMYPDAIMIGLDREDDSE